MFSVKSVLVGTIGLNQDWNSEMRNIAWGWWIKMTCDRVAGKVSGNWSKMFSDAISETATSFINVKFVAVGTYDGVDYIARGAGEVRSDVKSIQRTNNVSFTGNITTGVAATSVTRESARISIRIDGMWSANDVIGDVSVPPECGNRELGENFSDGFFIKKQAEMFVNDICELAG